MEQARLGADLQVARDEVLWLEHSTKQADGQHGDLAGLEASLLQVGHAFLSSCLPVIVPARRPVRWSSRLLICSSWCLPGVSRASPDRGLRTGN